jgi:hypothetical protein
MGSPPHEFPQDLKMPHTRVARRDRHDANNVTTRDVVFRALGSSDIVDLLSPPFRRVSPRSPAGYAMCPCGNCSCHDIESNMEETAVNEGYTITQEEGARPCTQNAATHSGHPAAPWTLDEVVYATTPGTENQKIRSSNTVYKGL